MNETNGSGQGRSSAQSGRMRGPPGASIYGTALSGVKRDARGLDEREMTGSRVRVQYDQQRGTDAFAGVPAGPRNPAPERGHNGNHNNSRREERWASNGSGNNKGRQNVPSIFDRVQPQQQQQPAVNQAFGQGAVAFDAVR